MRRRRSDSVGNSVLSNAASELFRSSIRMGLGVIVLVAFFFQGKLFGTFLVELRKSNDISSSGISYGRRRTRSKSNIISSASSSSSSLSLASPLAVSLASSFSSSSPKRTTTKNKKNNTQHNNHVKPTPNTNPPPNPTNTTTLIMNHLRQTRQHQVQALTTCLQNELPKDSQMTIDTILDPDLQVYHQLRTTWNQAKTTIQYPDMVVLPTTPQDISTVVKCAKQTGQYVCGRNGKHSFESQTCTYGIVVDTTRMVNVELVDKEKGVVRLQSGMTLGRVAVELEALGLILPMGQCASVGLTGLMLVGGQGLLARNYGMLSDHIGAIELVDEKGNIIRATKDNEYSDYLWLARGGGSGVQHFPGIITLVETENLPQLPGKSGDKVFTTLHIDFEATVDNAVSLLLAWQAFYMDPVNLQHPLFPRLTIEPWLKVEVFPASGDGNDDNNHNGTTSTAITYTNKLSLEVYFFGNDETHQQFFVTDGYMEKILNIHVNGHRSKVARHELLKFHRRLAGINSVRKLKSGIHGHDLNEDLKQLKMNRWKGYSAIAGDVVSEDAFRALAVGIFETQPLTRRYVELKPLGGAIQNKDKPDSAFWHRDAHWWVLSSHFWLSTDSDERVDAIYKSSRASHDRFIQGMGSSFAGLYSGYIDRSDSPERDLELYYGDHAHRIAEIKATRDPHNIFRIYLPNSMMETDQDVKQG